jgi:hypothetical protein
MIAFVQPFGLQSPGGGPRILRALLSTNHPPVLSINTSFYPAPPPQIVPELHLPLRRSFGRIEHTRFHRYFGVFDRLYRQEFQRNFQRALLGNGIRAVHLVHQSYDVVPIIATLDNLRMPLLLTIHDDFEHTLLGHPCMPEIRNAMRVAWNTAKEIFVITKEIGDEYSRRFGARQFEIVTDGLAETAKRPRPTPVGSLRLYFMGLFHYNYGDNLRAVLEALKIIRTDHPDWAISVTCRCGMIPVALKADDVPVKVLPFASEKEVEEDMLSADLLYQPLQFQPDAANFGRFSLSTKMITYLGSGLPILYHGPEESAANRLLTRHNAAIICTSLNPEQTAKQLLAAISNREIIASNALMLARSQFMLSDQQQRFWRKIQSALDPAFQGIQPSYG